MTSSHANGAVVVGASGGIGRALVSALGKSQAYEPIFALSRSEPPFPRSVRTLPINLSDEATFDAAAAKVGEAEPVGRVIAATGILHKDGVWPEKRFESF